MLNVCRTLPWMSYSVIEYGIEFSDPVLTYTWPSPSVTQREGAIAIDDHFDFCNFPELLNNPTPGTIRCAPEGSKQIGPAPVVPATVCTSCPLDEYSWTAPLPVRNTSPRWNGVADAAWARTLWAARA